MIVDASARATLLLFLSWAAISPTAGQTRWIRLDAAPEPMLHEGMCYDPIHDVGVVSIDSPPDTVYMDSVYFPMVSVANFGDSTETFGTWFIFYELWGGSWIPTEMEAVPVPPLPPGDTCQVRFMNSPLFFNSGADSFMMYALTHLVGDSNASNDTMTKHFFLHPPGVAEVAGSPPASSGYYVHQNRPNPFSRYTDIEYHIPAWNHITLEVYDMAGRLVETLIDGYQEPGRHIIRWNGTGRRGRSVPSGVYTYRLEAGTVVITKRATHFGQ